jgi:hypothetical protein
MPVPVSITHPQGKGLVAAKPEEMQSEGPFARMARLKVEAEAQKEAQQQQEPKQVDAEAPAGAAPAAPAAEAAPVPSSGTSIVINHLDFSYPGLGERPADAMTRSVLHQAAPVRPPPTAAAPAARRPQMAGQSLACPRSYPT